MTSQTAMELYSLGVNGFEKSDIGMAYMRTTNDIMLFNYHDMITQLIEWKELTDYSVVCLPQYNSREKSHSSRNDGTLWYGLVFNQIKPNGEHEDIGMDMFSMLQFGFHTMGYIYWFRRECDRDQIKELFDMDINILKKAIKKMKETETEWEINEMKPKKICVLCETTEKVCFNAEPLAEGVCCEECYKLVEQQKRYDAEKKAKELLYELEAEEEQKSAGGGGSKKKAKKPKTQKELTNPYSKEVRIAEGQYRINPKWQKWEKENKERKLLESMPPLIMK